MQGKGQDLTGRNQLSKFSHGPQVYVWQKD